MFPLPSNTPFQCNTCGKSRTYGRLRCQTCNWNTCYFCKAAKEERESIHRAAAKAAVAKPKESFMEAWDRAMADKRAKSADRRAKSTRPKGGAALAAVAAPAELTRLQREEALSQRDQRQKMHEQALNQLEQTLILAAKSCGAEAEVSAILLANLSPAARASSTGSERLQRQNQRDLHLKLRDQALKQVEQFLITKAKSCKPDAKIHKILPKRPLPAGWKEITVNGRVYYSNGIPGEGQKVKPQAMPEWNPRFRTSDEIEKGIFTPEYLARGDLNDQLAKERRAAGRQCRKCSRIFTDQDLAEKSKAGPGRLKTCRSCDVAFVL